MFAGCYHWRDLWHFKFEVCDHIGKTNFYVQHWCYNHIIWRSIHHFLFQHQRLGAIFFFLVSCFIHLLYKVMSIVAGNTKFSENLQTYLLSRDYHSLRSEFQTNCGKVWNLFFTVLYIPCFTKQSRFWGTDFNLSLPTPIISAD